MNAELKSPRISHLSWGHVEVEGHPPFKDTKVFPGGVNTNLRGYQGGGLFLEGDSPASAKAVQQGNVFDGNTVSFKAAPISACTPRTGGSRRMPTRRP